MAYSFIVFSSSLIPANILEKEQIKSLGHPKIFEIMTLHLYL